MRLRRPGQDHRRVTLDSGVRRPANQQDATARRRSRCAGGGRDDRRPALQGSTTSTTAHACPEHGAPLSTRSNLRPRPMRWRRSGPSTLRRADRATAPSHPSPDLLEQGTGFRSRERHRPSRFRRWRHPAIHVHRAASGSRTRSAAHHRAVRSPTRGGTMCFSGVVRESQNSLRGAAAPRSSLHELSRLLV